MSESFTRPRKNHGPPGIRGDRSVYDPEGRTDVSHPYAQLLIAVAASLGYWLLYRRARGDSPPLLRVAPANWLRVVEWAFVFPLLLEAVLPPLLAPFVSGVVLSEVLVSSATLLAVMAGLRAVVRSATLTVTRQGFRVFVFRLPWPDVEEIVTGEGCVRLRFRRRARGVLGSPILLSDFGWRITPEVGRRLRLFHWWLGPARDRSARAELVVASPRPGESSSRSEETESTGSVDDRGAGAWLADPGGLRGGWRGRDRSPRVR